MGFFRNLFGTHLQDTQQSIAVPTPSTQSVIHYDAGLVDTLLDHHARLGAIFKRIDVMRVEGNFDEVKRLLGQFKSGLQAHIMTENVRFYTYIERLTDHDAESRRVMSEFRRDMNSISRQVINFVKQYQAGDFGTSAERVQFAADYKSIEELLGQRFDNEEDNLYPMYAPG